MIQTEQEQKLQQLEEVIKKKRMSSDDGCLYKPERYDDENFNRFGYPKELYSIMG